MAYYFTDNPGYNKALVAEFYKHMKIPKAGTEHQIGVRVTSRIGRIEIEIDQNVIATTLDYHLPPLHTVNYPRAHYCTTDEINQALYTNLADARDPHRPGKFKEELKLINQVVHFNLNPRGAKNHPSLKDGKLLYAFMQ